MAKGVAVPVDERYPDFTQESKTAQASALISASAPSVRHAHLAVAMVSTSLKWPGSTEGIARRAIAALVAASGLGPATGLHRRDKRKLLELTTRFSRSPDRAAAAHSIA